MNRPILAALLLCCLVPLCARGQGPVLQQYANPSDPDSSDNDPSLLGKVLLKLKALAAAATTGAQPGANHAGSASVTATTDGAANFPARATRRRVAWINASTETVYVSFVSGTTGTAGVTVPANAPGGVNYTGAIYVHSASGTARVDFIEVYD